MGPGAAFLYLRSGSAWEGQRALVPATDVPELEYGAALALGHGRALVTSDRATAEAGADRAYLFRGGEGSSWRAEHVVAPDQPPQGRYVHPFTAVDLTAEWAAVGYPRRDGEPGEVRLYWVGE